MDNKKLAQLNCPVARFLASICDAWGILILRDAHFGVSRFDQFRTNLGIAPTILTQRLKILTAEGLLEKRRYMEHPPREEYVLTPAGRDLLPVIFAMGAWGHRHRRGGDFPRILDAEQGTEIKVVVMDEVTGAKIGTRPIRIATGDDD